MTTLTNSFHHSSATIRALTPMEDAYVAFLAELTKRRAEGDTTVYAWESFPAFRADHPELEDEA